MKGPEADLLYVTHIRECIANIESDIAGDDGVLQSNRTIRDAVLRNLQVLAESTQRLSDGIKSTEAGIPWAQIAGFRHRLVHDYFQIDIQLIRRVVREHLPDLKAAVDRMLERLNSSS
jgi:uncharacterized protein with HEPN domain